MLESSSIILPTYAKMQRQDVSEKALDQESTEASDPILQNEINCS
jgi:hypothetical protein